MADKNKMPPELLAHFKKKAEGKTSEQAGSTEDSDKAKRKEAVKKARIRMEEKSRRSGPDEDKKAGQERSEASR